MFGLLSLLPSAFSAITNISNAIANTKIASINATTQQEKILADERTAGLEAQRDLLIEEAKQSKLPIYMQTLIASGPAFYLTKVFIWDYSLGLGTTANVSPIEWQVIMAVVGFYTLHSIVSAFKK